MNPAQFVASPHGAQRLIDLGREIEITQPIQQAARLLDIAYHHSSEDVRVIASLMFTGFMSRIAYERPELQHKIAFMAIDAYLYYGLPAPKKPQIITLSK